MPYPPPQLDELAPLLMVHDMPTALSFYRDKLGASVVQQAGPTDDVGWVLLALHGVQLMLNTMHELPQRPTSRDTQRQQHHADTIIYFGCADLDGLYNYLYSRGLQLAPPTRTGYGFRAITLTDPDGYNLVFHWPD